MRIIGIVFAYGFAFAAPTFILFVVFWYALRHEWSLLLPFLFSDTLLVAAVWKAGFPLLGFVISLGGLVLFTALALLSAAASHPIRKAWRRVVGMSRPNTHGV